MIVTWREKQTYDGHREIGKPDPQDWFAFYFYSFKLLLERLLVRHQQGDRFDHGFTGGKQGFVQFFFF